MRVEGDFVVCKKNVYTDIYEDSFQSKMSKLFKKPYFKKGQRYKIDRMTIFYWYNSGATYINYNLPGNQFLSPTYYIGKVILSEIQLDEYFYTKKEERNLKLNKLKKSQV